MQVEYKLILIELHIMKSLQVDNVVNLRCFLSFWLDIHNLLFYLWIWDFYCLDTWYDNRKHIHPIEILTS